MASAPALALLLGSCGAAAEPPRVPESAPEPAPEAPAAAAPAPLPRIRNLFYEPELFASGNAAPARYSLEGRLAAGMIPHHLLASDMISGFFLLAVVQERPYDGILLISPSHFPENCNSDAVTALAAWDTHLGAIEPDRALVEAILADPVLSAEDNPQAVERDHGAAGLTPYIRKYLPEVPLAVCLLANRLSPQRLRAFQDSMAQAVLGRNVLVIASADCSHYLMPPEPEERDKETIEAITLGQRARLLSFDDRNIDSPQSVTSFLRAAQEAGGTITLLGHSSSDQKLPYALSNSIYREGTTTYLVFAAGVTD